MHVAEDDEQAVREVRVGERLETQTYFSETLKTIYYYLRY